MTELSRHREIMAMSLLEAAHLWIRGKLDSEPPDLQEGIYITAYLGQFVSMASYKNISKSEIDRVLQVLIVEKPDISVHFQKVANGRKWFKFAYILWDIAFGKDLPHLSRRLEAIVLNFDISKYGPFEALGFHFKFSGNYSMLGDSPEENEWIAALNHYVMNTTYSPERFTHRGMPTNGFITSVINMVARRLASQLQDKQIVCPAEIMAVPTTETDKYTHVRGDHRDAIRYLLMWGRKLECIVNQRFLHTNWLLDKWERYTGLKIDGGLTYSMNDIERVRGNKIVDGKLIKATDSEMWTGFKLEGGDWVETWQQYILHCYKEQIYPTYGFDPAYELRLSDMRVQDN